MSRISELGIRKVNCFLKDQLGAGTIVDLVWFTLLVGVCVLAIDMTDRYRVSTVPEDSAAASALATVTDPPVVTAKNGTEATETVVASAQSGVPTDVNGEGAIMTDAVVDEWDRPRQDRRLPIPIN